MLNGTSSSNGVLSPSRSSTSAQPPNSTTKEKKSFRNVFGIASLDFSRPRSPPVFSEDEDDSSHQPVLITTGSGASQKRASSSQSRSQSSPFVAQDNGSSHTGFSRSPHSPLENGVGAASYGGPPTPRSASSSLDVEEMKIDLTAAASMPPPQQSSSPAQRRESQIPQFQQQASSFTGGSPSAKGFRPFVAASSEAGPWIVSVAETPTEPKSYNIYVKTPTHNLTLTRSPKEVIELHSKLRDAFPNATLPPFPLSKDTLVPGSPGGNGKRRSSFLHTLTNLGKSNSNLASSKTQASGHTRPATSATFPTPLISPPADNQADPFSANEQQQPSTAIDGSSPNHQTTTSLAYYLTTVSNDPRIRVHRTWKRFVRVRTDDLESVRVERAVKRVRSDVGAKHHNHSASVSSSQYQRPAGGDSNHDHGNSVGAENIPPVPALPAGVAAANGFVNGLDSGGSERGNGLPMLSLGGDFGLGMGTGSLGLGLSPSDPFKGSDFGSKMGDLTGKTEHEREGTQQTLTQAAPASPEKKRLSFQTPTSPSTLENKRLSSQAPTSPSTLENKRLSSVMAIPSAFSSDSALVDSILLGAMTSENSAPTPTPGGTSGLSSTGGGVVEPEAVALPPSPAQGHKDATSKDHPEHAVVSGLPTPVQSPIHPAASPSRIVRSASADPDKASKLSRQFKALDLNNLSTTNGGTESGAEGDNNSFLGGGDGGVTTDAEADVRSTMSNSEIDINSTPSKSKTQPKKRTKRAAQPKPAKKVTLEDFEMMRVLGKGCAGKVLLVKYKKTSDLYALKAITKRHVLAHQELQHTLTEQAVLKRMSKENKDPFVVKLWWSFHDKDNLFLVMDFHPGGDLATQLARWGRLGRDRARFYAAEIVEGVEGLHAAGVIYRDLKPENILIGGDGHIVLTDFGLSKEFPRRTISGGSANGGESGTDTPSGTFAGTDFYAGNSAPGTPKEGGGGLPHWMSGSVSAVGSNGERDMAWGGQKDVTSTFCGTAEYLAPEVIQGLPYSYEVDWWSFGTMLYEMLSGITPFWANNHSDMYVRVLQDELTFAEDRAMDQDTKSLIRGLLQRNPALRMSEPRIKRHPYFSMIDWDHVYYKRYIPPYIPPIDPSNASDTQNFDETFLEMNPTIENEDMVDEVEREKTDDEGFNGNSKTDGEDSIKAAAKPKPEAEHLASPKAESVDVFDGYSFKGRHSVVIDDEDEGYAGVDEDEPEDDELADAKKVTDALAAMHASVTPTAHTDGDTSETRTLDPRNENAEPDTTQQQVSGRISGSVSPSTITSTVPESSAVSASIVTDNESVVAPKVHREAAAKQGSSLSETTATTTSSALPSLTIATTATTTPSGEYAESPSTVASESPSRSGLNMHTKVVSEGSDDALKAPLPLSPVIEAVDPVTGHLAEEDAIPTIEQPKTPSVSIVAPSTIELASPVEPKAVPSTPVQARTKANGRREKSGIDALDRLRHTKDDDDVTEREDEWDLVETPHGEDRNGAKGASLWQRGVVDRYRLAVFRKGSTPRPPRSSSTYDSITARDTVGSPSPTSETKQRRGRTNGLSLRKSTGAFLRAKSPSTSASAFSSTASRASLAQQASAGATSGGLLTPSPSVPVGMGKPKHSLKSKSSALSKVSANSPGSSDQSVTDLNPQQQQRSGADVTSPLRSPIGSRSDAKSPSRIPSADDVEKHGNLNLKKMKKEMMSLFSGGAPRH
ncbi:hypothetical protein FRB94_009198 [Tulasnella sp. JGI-2019a]|nr:hypothetical protein FRB94_009198 [Tulasnella sp. JGI-2019a]